MVIKKQNTVNIFRENIETALERALDFGFDGGADLETQLGPDFVSQVHRNTEAHGYGIFTGGKRLRPLCTLFMAGAVGGEGALPWALAPAVALELTHASSLVHDDLPCMDNDDVRRGQPTAHRVFGEAQAILAGDGLLVHAYHHLASAALPPALCVTLIKILSEAAGPNGMILGQWLDLWCPQPSGAAMAYIHGKKTGAILSAGFQMGAVVGQVWQWWQKQNEQELSINRMVIPEEYLQVPQWVKQLGDAFGLAFQIRDDVLDNTVQNLADKDHIQKMMENYTIQIKTILKEKKRNLNDDYISELAKMLRSLF